MTTVGNRTSDHDIDPMFLERWSPRAFTPETISDADLMSIFEAARWAPSSYNSQPWRFVYARRDTPHWDKLLGLLIEFNQSWAKNASALVIMASQSTMTPPGKTDPVPSHSHSMDAGSAWGYAALQAMKLGWHTHGMVGFDLDRAFAELGFPPGYRVEMAFAIGRKGDPATLPDAMREREVPSPRKPLSETVFEGRFAG
jgi:nitroreductase